MSKILLMNNGYPTNKNPKHSSYIKNIKETLEEAGHMVHLLVLDSDFKSRLNHLYHYGKFYWQILKYDFSQYDYVLINHYAHFSIPLSRFFSRIKQPVIHWHGEDLFPRKKAYKNFFAKAVKKLPRRTKHITPSYYFQKELTDKYNIPASQISISPSGGVDTDLFKPYIKSKEENILKLGFASGLAKQKGIEMVLQLANETALIEESINKKIEIHYILYGREKEKYAAMLNQYANTIGWSVMPSFKMPSFYNAIDILLFPTLRKQESLGLVALEAMSCNCAVLGTHAFAVKEYVISGISGETFEMNNYEDFKHKLIKIADDLEVYKPRNTVVEKYSKNSVIQFYKDYFC